MSVGSPCFAGGPSVNLVTEDASQPGHVSRPTINPHKSVSFRPFPLTTTAHRTSSSSITMSFYRTLWVLSRTPLVPTEASKQAAMGVQLTTFREYSLPSLPSSSSRPGYLRSLSTSASLSMPKTSEGATSGSAPDVSFCNSCFRARCRHDCFVYRVFEKLNFSDP